MGNAKVIFGNETLIDLTGDTVNTNNLLSGATAHDRSGTAIQGAVTVPSALDDLTDVDINTPADGDLLQYNATSQKWENSDTIPDELTAMQENGAYNWLPNDAASQTINGVTFTVNADKSVTVSGKATGGNAIFPISSATYGFTKNHATSGPLILSGCPAGGAPGNATYSFWYRGSNDGTTDVYNNAEYGNGVTVPYYPYINVYIRIQNGYEFTEPKTFYPMLYDARLVNPPYQPFTMTNRELTDAVTTVEDITSDITINSTVATYTDFKALKYGKVIQIAFVSVKRLGTGSILTTVPAKYKPKSRVDITFYNMTEAKIGGIYVMDSGVMEFYSATPTATEFHLTLTWLTS